MRRMRCDLNVLLQNRFRIPNRKDMAGVARSHRECAANPPQLWSGLTSVAFRAPRNYLGIALLRVLAGIGDRYTGNPFFFANSFSEVCGRAPMC